MFSTRTAFPDRTSRLTSWRKKDLEIATRWRKDYDTLVRTAPGDHPRVAVRHLIDAARLDGWPFPPMFQVYIAKGPKEFQEYLRKLYPNARGGMGYGNTVYREWPGFRILPYTVGGMPEQFAREFHRSWNRQMRPWQSALQQVENYGPEVMDGAAHAEWFPHHSIWETIPAAFATAFFATGMRLRPYQNADNGDTAHAMLNAAQNCFDAAVSSTLSWLVVCRSPKTVKVNEYGVLHATSGPALEWEGDAKIYLRRGVIIPKSYAEKPEDLTFETITAERNLEIKSVLIELFGEERYIQESGYVLAVKDDRGELYTKPKERTAWVKVVNSSPEPDGTFRSFFLPVPHGFTTPTDAIGWTFNKRGDEYEPLFET